MSHELKSVKSVHSLHNLRFNGKYQLNLSKMLPQKFSFVGNKKLDN